MALSSTALPVGARRSLYLRYGVRAATALAGALFAYKLFEALTSTRYAVAGDSMRPTLAPGDYLLVSLMAYARSRPSPGDIVVVRDPERVGMTLIKRIAATSEGAYVVLGDNGSASRDSRAFGPVPRDDILGRAWLRYWPPRRFGLL